MNDVTAIVLSKLAVPKIDLKGMVPLFVQNDFDRPGINAVRELHATRLKALSLVTTKYACFVDDDDALPDDSADVVAKCVEHLEAGYSAAYTDELERRVYADGKVVEEVMRRTEYSAEDHVRRYGYLMHHLVVFNAAQAKFLVEEVLPKGLYWTEFLLYRSLAALGNAAYVPRTGYIWNRKEYGMHTKGKIALAQQQSLDWVKMNIAEDDIRASYAAWLAAADKA